MREICNMDREIKFRGKTSVNDGETMWVYGTLQYLYEVVYDKITDTFIHERLSDKAVINNENGQYEVSLDSVGQFTGAIDKNGVDIYEGDIVRFENGVFRQLLFDKFVSNYIDFVVKYKGGFFNIAGYDLVSKDSFEVLGNKYDNSELLEKLEVLEN